MEQVKTQIKGPIGIITLTNPPHNFMTAQMVRELDEVTRKWSKDSAIRSIIITGGIDGIFITHYSIMELYDAFKIFRITPKFLKRFSVGFSLFLGSFLRLIYRIAPLGIIMEKLFLLTPLYGLVQLECIHRVFKRLQSMDKVVIAAINGETMGGGCELVLSCDFRFMADGDYRIGLIEAICGIIPGAGGTQRLPRLIGTAKSLEMIFDGTVLKPEEAKELGLIHRVVERDRLIEEAMTLAERMAKRPRWSIRGVKRSVYFGASSGLCWGLESEKANFMATGFTQDSSMAFEEYLERFNEGKRPRDIFEDFRKNDNIVFRDK